MLVYLLKRNINFIIKFFIIVFFLLSSQIVLAKNILINEIFPNPFGRDSGKEFIELRNKTDEDFPLSDWTVQKISLQGKIKTYEFNKTDYIAKKGYFVLKVCGLNNDGATIQLIDVNDEIADEIKYQKVVEGFSYNRDENNEKNLYWAKSSEGKKNIENPKNKIYPNIVINEIFPNPLEDESKKEFIELYNPNKEEVDLSNWRLKDASKTGLYIFPKNSKIKAKSYLTIYRSDFRFALNNSGGEEVILLDPNDDFQKGEYKDKIQYSSTIEGKSYNHDEDDLSKKWYWSEITPNKKNILNLVNKIYPTIFLSELLPNPKGDEAKKEFIELYNPNETDLSLFGWSLRDKTSEYIFSKNSKIKAKSYLTIYRSDFKFALNNSSEEEVKLIAPNLKIIHLVKYDKAPEKISYNFNQETKTWFWSRFQTPGKINRFNHRPSFKIDVKKKIYKNINSEFVIKNLKDKDNDKLKVSWDFGDGHHSYLKKASHKFTRSGKYLVKITVSDGQEKVTKVVKIKVKKYPKYKLKIVELLPNPAGKDTGQEYILLKNYSKKKINLAKYFVATGRSKKKIVRHPFYDDFIIKPHNSRKLFNKKISKFSMLNKSGIVQLVYPNGKVANEVKYNKNKILSNERYVVDEDGKWHWYGGVKIKQKITTKENQNQGIQITKAGEAGNGLVDPTINTSRKQCNVYSQILVDNWLKEIQVSESIVKKYLWINVSTIFSKELLGKL